MKKFTITALISFCAITSAYAEEDPRLEISKRIVECERRYITLMDDGVTAPELIAKIIVEQKCRPLLFELVDADAKSGNYPNISRDFMVTSTQDYQLKATIGEILEHRVANKQPPAIP